MNDLHSRFDNMMRIATYINKVKKDTADKNEKVIVTDLGDHMDRMQLETEGTNGKVNVAVLNRTGVDVATIGNNEGLTFTKSVLAKIYQERNFKIVACNIKDDETDCLPDWLDEFWIQEISDNLKIGWIGATASYETFYKLQGWNIKNPLPIIKEIVEKIKPKVDIIILLSHLGLRSDEIIAREIPGIDVILGAHTHRYYERGIKREDQPLICQVGIFGEYIGHLTIDYDLQTRKILDINENTINVTGIEPDHCIEQIVLSYRDMAKKELSELIAILDEPLSISLETDSPLGNLLADGVRKWVHADIGLTNTGQILEDLDKGIVTRKRIHEICPSPINACRVSLTGKQIKNILEQSLLEEFIYNSVKGFGFRGRYLGTISVSGIFVEYNLKNPPYHRVEKIIFNNDIIKEDEEYLVGTLDMFTFSGGYSLRDGKDIEYYLPEFIRDILAFQLGDKESIKESFNSRRFHSSSI